MLKYFQQVITRVFNSKLNVEQGQRQSKIMSLLTDDKIALERSDQVYNQLVTLHHWHFQIPKAFFANQFIRKVCLAPYRNAWNRCCGKYSKEKVCADWFAVADTVAEPAC